MRGLLILQTPSQAPAQKSFEVTRSHLGKLATHLQDPGQQQENIVFFASHVSASSRFCRGSAARQHAEYELP